MWGSPPSVLLAAPPRQDGEDRDKGELMYFHGAASTLSPTVSARGGRGGWGGCSGVGPPRLQADTLLLFKMELVPGSSEPVKTAMNFAKQL